MPENDPQVPQPEPAPVPSLPARRPEPHVSEQPPSVWPEGVLLVLAAATVGIIAFRHRVWVQRKVTEAQKLVTEFQQQGGLDELTKVAQQAVDFLKPDRSSE
ncbi:MAG: hypothetical protein FJX77_06990 [Armatimonadetes bacterium]|nr:hypothetical protein [Armatimonadota bacterium]